MNSLCNIITNMPFSNETKDMILINEPAILIIKSVLINSIVPYNKDPIRPSGGGGGGDGFGDVWWG
jgi:hypothetical protein